MELMTIAALQGSDAHTFPMILPISTSRAMPGASLFDSNVTPKCNRASTCEEPQNLTENVTLRDLESSKQLK